MYSFQQNQERTPGQLASEDLKIPVKANVRYQTDIKDHFHFIGNQISKNELNSMLPFYKCDEIGHEANIWDLVCIEPSCKLKGMACGRCVYLKHKDHITKVIPLQQFVADLVKSQSDRKQTLNSELEKCNRFHDFIVNQVQEFIDELIEHFSLFLAAVHKYHTIFSNQFEDAMIKSDVITHRILQKQHIRRDHFQKYIIAIVESLERADEKAYSYQGQETQASKDYLLKDYEKAFEFSKSFVSEMTVVARELKYHFGEYILDIEKKIDLHKLSHNIPQFDKATLIDQNLYKKKFKNLDDIFSEKRLMPTIPSLGYQSIDSIDALLKKNYSLQQQQKFGQQSMNLQQNQALPQQHANIMPKFLEYQASENFQCTVDPQRRKIVLGRLFQAVISSSIMKLSSIKTGLNELSCICAIGDDVLCAAGRFSPNLEFYQTSDRSFISKVDTNTNQGAKCMLFLRNNRDDGPGEWEALLIVGTYSEDTHILSYQVDILRTMEGKVAVSAKIFKKFEKKYEDAVTCLEHIRGNEFFAAGYSTGSVAIFSTRNAIPLSVLHQIYEGPVTALSLLDDGKMFASVSHQKIRYHYINELSHERIEQKITSFFVNANSITTIINTNAFNEEGSYLKFRHFICGDLRDDNGSEDFKPGTIRVLRMVENFSRLTEEAEVPIFDEHKGNNAVKEIIIIEPRVKQRVLWALTFGSTHKIKLWELKSAFTQTLKLWEKDVQDFLKAPGSNVIKAKLLYESHEFANIKWSDVMPKVQVLSAYENQFTGKILIKFAIVNHLNKSDIDIFDLEMMISYA